MLRKQLIVLVVFAAVMAAITALSYVVTATTDKSDCQRGSIDRAEACR
jgi:Na+-translocating ferredoxin:NAD+ oxidoreductase RnfG subunit